AHLLGERAEAGHVRHRQPPLGELADRHRRAVQAERRDDRVHARAVGQAGVDHGRGLVDAAPDLGHDLVEDPAQVRVVGEAGVGREDPAAALDEDLTVVVHHDLGDGLVLQEPLERAVAGDLVRDLAGEQVAVGTRQRRLLGGQRRLDDPAQAAVEGRLVDLAREHRGPQALDDDLVDAVADVGELVFGVRIGAAVLEAVGERGQRQASLGVSTRAATRSPMARNERAGLDLGCMQMIGREAFTLCGTPRSDGTATSGARPSTLVTSVTSRPTLVFARFSTGRIRAEGTSIIWSVSIPTFMFFRPGRSNEPSMTIRSAWSTAAMTPDVNAGGVSTMTTSYVVRARSRMAVMCSAVTASAWSGRTGASRTFTPSRERPVKPRKRSASIVPPAVARS